MAKLNPKTRSGTIAALDIGSTKICCFIARSENGGLPRVTGIGHQVAKGVRGGAIVDMDQAEASIIAAVNAAEKMANETIRQVIVNLSAGYPASETVGVEVAISGHEVGEIDMRRVLDQGSPVTDAEERQLIHSIPIGYTIDGNRGIRDPRGMFGDRLGASMHVVTAASGAVRNLVNVVERGHLDIEKLVVSPYASGLASLVEDEVDLGVTVIDMGGGTTSLAVFFDGAVVHTDVVTVGGCHVTNDVARGLSTPLIEAERLKTLYGSATSSATDERELIDVPLVGEDNRSQPNHVPKSYLNQIIQPRLEETFELVRGQLEASGFDKLAGRRVVLTGGASQLQGVRELAASILDKQVRLGRPIGMAGLAESTCGPAFATCAGLLHYAVGEIPDRVGRMSAVPPASAGLFGRFGHWLRENF
ncbi:MAG: cell division protein FtsA [Proteobacteria bacterium]|nr:cell division protein FtsA [Pseudomonadota bacterium]MBI3496575.1 cell division protein FtsA [Pseudomonadota bacterium]